MSAGGFGGLGAWALRILSLGGFGESLNPKPKPQTCETHTLKRVPSRQLFLEVLYQLWTVHQPLLLALWRTLLHPGIPDMSLGLIRSKILGLTVFRLTAFGFRAFWVWR